ncbi:MAG: DNA internalization-related competence protein ComEC/Rec2 [Deltaproteobacteria bacterium]|nr:DNA internalization-related competence protein ComEC/Rec2 [Deltaproteobacteria bacterium]
MLGRPLLPLLFSMLAGILISYYCLPAFPFYSSHSIFLWICAALVLILFLPSGLKLACLVAVFFLFGVFLDFGSRRSGELATLADQRPIAVIQGVVLEPPRIGRRYTKLAVEADKVLVEGRLRHVREKVVVTVYDSARKFAPGDRVICPARLKPFRNFANPGHYDYELAMRLKGFSCAASVSDGRRVVPLGKGSLGFPSEQLEKVRKPLRMFLDKELSQQEGALFSALILGERQNIDVELREDFQAAGLGHVLAVSGLHIGLVAWIFFSILKISLSFSYRLALRIEVRRLAAVLTCIPVIAYAFLAGFHVSTQRAMIMVLAYLFSIILGREREVWSTLCLAALVVLAADPHALLGISFQLSFLAVVGILWLGPYFYHKFVGFFPLAEQSASVGAQIYRYVAGLISITISATVFLLPITVFYFHRISVVSVPANCIVVPILGIVVLPLGLLVAFLVPFSQLLAHFLLQLDAHALNTVVAIVHFLGSSGFSSLWLVTPNAFEIVLFYAFLILLHYRKRWRWARPGLYGVVLLIVLDVSFWTWKTQFNRNLRITYLDVGQGNAALVQFPGRKRMIVDGGGFSGGNFDVGQRVLAPFLFYSKIRRIDYIVLTHPQTDHMDGLRFLTAHFHVKEFWSNGEWVETESFHELMKTVRAKNLLQIFPDDLRQARKIGGVKVELLHPPPGAGVLKGNNRSLVLKFSWGGVSCLFPGDLEAAGERMVVSNSSTKLRSNILLAPHHGSKTSCSTLFLEYVKPQLCIISSGAGNPFHFPNKEALERLRVFGCKTVRIDRRGAVEILIEPGSYQLKYLANR